MIIKATRISTSSGAGAVAAHVLRGEKNEEILLLQGSEAEMHAAMKDAEAAGAKYGLRHYKISPAEEMTSEDARQVLADLGREFGFDPSTATLIEHQKPRAAGGGFDRHWHAIVPEYDPVAGRVLDSHWMRPRHEKVARIAEARLGHEVVPGRFNASVQRHLEAEGRLDVAERIQPATEVPRPREGYATNVHQWNARKGNDLPADRLAVREAWEKSDGGQAFRAALAEHGISIRAGDKANTWIAERDGVFLGAVHRLVKESREEVAQRLEAAPPLPEPPTPDAPKPQPEPPTPDAPKPQPEPPTPDAPKPQPEPDGGDKQHIEHAHAHARAHAYAVDASTAPQPLGGGGGGSSSQAPAAEAPKQNSVDTFSSEDPTAGIEPPKVGDLAGELRYREQVMKRAAEIAERKARQKTPAPNQQGGKNGNSQTSGGGGGGSDKAAAAAAAAAHEALIEFIEKARKVHEQREFDKLLEAYISAARLRHEARRSDARESRSGERQTLAESSARDRHSRRDERAEGQREPDAVAGDSHDARRHHGNADADRERAARAAQNLERNLEAARLESAFEAVDLSHVRAAHEAMMRRARPDPFENLSWAEEKARKDEFRAQLWTQFRDDARVLREFDAIDRAEARRAEIEAAEPIRARMRERWAHLTQAQMRRARALINERIKAAGDAVREQQKQRPKRTFEDYVRGLAEHFNDERAQFILAYEERRKAQKTALFQPVNDALEAIAHERSKAPKPRDPDKEGKAARRALWAPYEAAQERLREAREEFDKMERPRGWRIFNAAAYDAYDAARERVASAHAECESVKPTPMKLDSAEAKARFDAQVGQGEHMRWMQRRGNNLDQREAALLAVRDAMQRGDKQMIRAMRVDGIDAALELQRKRDEEEKRQREAALKAANVVQMRQRNAQSIESHAPRMR